MIKNVDADLSDFITQAIIIPLDISSIRYKESIAVASKIETLVGEYLVNFAKNGENLVPVISPKSHLYY